VVGPPNNRMQQTVRPVTGRAGQRPRPAVPQLTLECYTGGISLGALTRSWPTVWAGINGISVLTGREYIIGIVEASDEIS
jgi:hypothetical protein